MQEGESDGNQSSRSNRSGAMRQKMRDKVFTVPVVKYDNFGE